MSYYGDLDSDGGELIDDITFLGEYHMWSMETVTVCDIYKFLNLSDYITHRWVLMLKVFFVCFFVEGDLFFPTQAPNYIP